MRKVLEIVLTATILSAIDICAYAQCWSISANAAPSTASTVHPSGNQSYEAIIVEMEPALQKGMGVRSRVFLTEMQRVYADPVSGNVFFGRKYFDFLDQKYKSIVKQVGTNPIPLGIKLIIAHEYAHQFQFRMFKKKNIALGAPTVVDELQADILASYFLGSSLRVQFANLPEEEKWNRFADQSGGATLIVAELGDPFFKDASHHGTSMNRRLSIQEGFQRGWENRFGGLETAMTAKEDEVYDWSRKYADAVLKGAPQGVIF